VLNHIAIHLKVPTGNKYILYNISLSSALSLAPWHYITNINIGGF